MSDKSYDEALKEQRKITADLPLSTAGDVIGMIAGPGKFAKLGMTTAGSMGGNALVRALGYGAEGALYGAANDAGRNDGTIEDKLSAAKHGAVIGGIL